MPAAVVNMTHKLMNVARHFMAPHWSDNQVGVANNEGEIIIETIYYPIVGSADVRVYKPESNTFFTGIPVSPAARVLLPSPVAVPRQIVAAPAVCLLDRDSVVTYDGLAYNASSGSGCDQVVTKDCSGRYAMAVLSRMENDEKVGGFFFLQ